MRLLFTLHKIINIKAQGYDYIGKQEKAAHHMQSINNIFFICHFSNKSSQQGKVQKAKYCKYPFFISVNRIKTQHKNNGHNNDKHGE